MTTPTPGRGPGDPTSRACVAIIIPAFNEATTIETALAHLSTLEGEREVVVVENGSTDETYALASPLARTIRSAPGRGPALNAGAACSSGEVILFLHADTTLPAGALAAVARALADPATVGGYFSIRFAGDDWRSAVVGALYRGFARLGFFYGDSAIFVRRSTFEALGGFKPIPLMEDLDFCLRLRRTGRTVRLPETVLSSNRRWREQGFLRMALVYLLLQGLYLLGVRHSSLYRWYKPIR